MKKVGVIFWRLGPYHVSRASSVANQFEVHVVETCRLETTNSWDVVESSDRYFRHQLMETFEKGRNWTKELRRRMHSALDEIQPDAVAVSGWGLPDSMMSIEWCVDRKKPIVCMSESTPWDEARVKWKEWIKRRLVGMFAAGFAGGTAHRDYFQQLGMPADRIFLGYDAVDNGYFSREAAGIRRRALGVGEDGSHEDAKARSEELSLSKKSNPTLSGFAPSRENLNSSNLSVSASQRENPVFLSSGRFVEKKNFLRLLEAYAAYRRRRMADTKWKMGKIKDGSHEDAKTRSEESIPNPNLTLCASASPRENTWDLVILGDGELRGQLLSACRRLNLPYQSKLKNMPESEAFFDGDGHRGRVCFEGFKQYPDLPEYYANAGVFVHASTTEQWGLVVNEAMASGLPVLVSNRCGCSRDLLENGVNGFTFDPDNMDELAERMMELSSMSEENRLNMGKESQRIIADWGPDRFAQGLKAAVEKAIEVGPKRASVFDCLLLKALMMRG